MAEWVGRVGWHWGLAALLAGPMVGCSHRDDRPPVFTVQGKVLYRGTPASGGFVVFHPKASATDADRPTAKIENDGSFALTTYENHDGAPAGDYAVTVQWFRPVEVNHEWQAGPNVIPYRYGDPGKTPLKVTVNPSANALSPFEIVR